VLSVLKIPRVQLALRANTLTCQVISINIGTSVPIFSNSLYRLLVADLQLKFLLDVASSVFLLECKHIQFLYL
jgi:hypothetical protein